MKMKNNKKTTSLRSVTMKAMQMNDKDKALGANTVTLTSDDPKNYSGQDLTGQDLTGANLTRAIFSGAIFSGAIFSGAIFLNTICPNGRTTYSGCQ